jgi:L-amino acid N-acyltransferase YncA
MLAQRRRKVYNLHKVQTMIKYVTPLNEISDLKSVAESLSTLLASDANADIRQEFSSADGKYAGDPSGLLLNLAQARERFELGELEDYVCFAGETAIGMAQVARCRYTISNMEPGSAILSSYTCRPWRQQGFARLSMTERIKAVNERFGGTAGTIVNSNNLASKRLVLSTGFIPVGHTNGTDTYYYNNPLYSGRAY